MSNIEVVHRLRMGFVNAWLVKTASCHILIDTGKPRNAPKLLSLLQAQDISPSDIALIVVTHAHYDHVGAVGALKRTSCAQVAIHSREAELLRTGGFEISDGLNWLGKVRAFLGRHIMPRRNFAFEPVEPDILVDRELRLDDFGVDATLIHSPGHSTGSMSLLFDTGELFPGDLMIKQPLGGKWRYCPLYGSSVSEIKRSWRKLLERGAKHVYPSHGNDFTASELKKML